VRVEGGIAYEGTGTVMSATPRDKTAPAPPASLRLERKDGGVLVTWRKGNEADLAGYNVYRVTAKQKVKINRDLLAEPGFTDANPGPEPYVSYFVTAIDKSGNESGPSQEQTIILKE
jgi:fibronectin type 3 domain-containing protein